jgi:hypothetical protein
MAWGVQKGRRWPQAAHSAGRERHGSLGVTFGSPWPLCAIRLWLEILIGHFWKSLLTLNLEPEFCVRINLILNFGFYFVDFFSFSVENKQLFPFQLIFL